MDDISVKKKGIEEKLNQVFIGKLLTFEKPVSLAGKKEDNIFLFSCFGV